MNARDSIKPKSIRIAILMALSDGAITTLDDLQIKVDEPRKKVLDNAVHAANDGLVKRLRDDVTNLAAYQITGDGRKYLAKFADGIVKEPVTDGKPVEVEKAVITPSVNMDVLLAEAHKKAVIDWERAMMNAVGEDGIGSAVEAIERIKQERDAYWTELKSIRSSISASPEESTLDEVNRIAYQLALSRSAEAPAVTGYVILRPVKPLLRCSRLEKATERALSFAKGGSKAQVFALVPVGVAVPGAEWRHA